METSLKLSDFIRYTAPVKRFRPNWTAAFGGIEERGATQDEATASLFGALRASTVGDFTPVVIPFGGYIALVWRDQATWMYTIRPDSVKGEIKSNFHSIGPKRDEAEARARVHLAQYVLDDMLGGADFTTEEIAKIILEPGDQRDFFSLAARSIEVKMLMATGLTWQEANIQLDGLHLQRSR